MKIGILTHYDVNNQGAQLQMYALSKEIEKLGHEVKILTFVKNYDFDLEKKLRYQPSIKSIPTYIKEYLIKRGIGSTYHNYKKLKANKVFRKLNFKFENYATSDIDIAVVGSDEVFSIPMGVNIMMYGHCVNTDKMIAYAPSFGQTNAKLLTERHAKELVASGLSKFIDLSARDENTQKTIKELTGREAKMVCDPAILHKFDDNEITTNIKLPSKKYIVVYAYDYNMNESKEIESIKKYAKDNNLLIVSPGTYHKWCDKNISCNAIEWVEIIKNAECVITDTFHGTITATIMNVPMAVLIRNSLNSNKMTDLLKKLNIEDRRVKEVNYEELEKVFSKNINFDIINSNIETLRKDSLEYLKSAIDKCKE